MGTIVAGVTLSEESLDRALAAHVGEKKVGSPLFRALREFLDDPADGRLRAVAFSHKVSESTLRKSVASFRRKMKALGAIVMA